MFKLVYKEVGAWWQERNCHSIQEAADFLKKSERARTNWDAMLFARSGVARGYFQFNYKVNNWHFWDFHELVPAIPQE